MNLKLCGAVLVILSCSAVGFMTAASWTRQVKLLRELIHLLDYMGCELQYRLTPLPELCRKTANQACPILQKFFRLTATELEHQVSPVVSRCVAVSVAQTTELPESLRDCCLMLGQTLGEFNLEGQMKGLQSVREECLRKLNSIVKDRSPRVRSYQTLGLCAGAALVILFI